MEKDYILKKIIFLDIEMYKIIYNFKIERTSLPTRFINIIVHHTGNTNTIQGIIDLHVKKNRFSAIGYHFIISKSGKIYLSRELKYAGAHTYSHNRNSIGIAFLGNYDIEELSINQKISFEKLIQTLEKYYPIKRILGHNQAIYSLIKSKYYKEKLENLNLLEINSSTAYKKVMNEITTKILKNNSSESDVNLIKKLKTCPGIKTYSFLKKEIEKFNL